MAPYGKAADLEHFVVLGGERAFQMLRQVVALERRARHLEQADLAAGLGHAELAVARNVTGLLPASSRMLAISRPRSITLSVARPMTTPAKRMERPECEPPPTGTMSVSPCTRRTSSNGTPSHSLTHWVKQVSCPCPLDSVPTMTSTAVRAHDHFGALARIAHGEFDVIGEPDAAQLAALLGLAPPLGEAVPFAELQARRSMTRSYSPLS